MKYSKILDFLRPYFSSRDSGIKYSAGFSRLFRDILDLLPGL